MRLLALAAAAALAWGTEPEPFSRLPDAEVQKAVREIHASRPALGARVEAVSERFLGTPYRLGPLGEGPKGEFDREPLRDFHEVDCTTYVEQVMALALEPDLRKAERVLQRIRYKDGRVGYETRNHFPEVDWIPNNVKAGFLRDITREVAGDKTKTALKLISKRAWYVQKSSKDLEGFTGLSEAQAQAIVERWRKRGDGLPDEQARVDYVPMDALPELLARIPSGTIANLVREDKEGVPVLISHQVLLIDSPEGKLVRHASSTGKVEQMLALPYFYKYFNSKWRLVGLNLDQVNKPGP